MKKSTRYAIFAIVVCAIILGIYSILTKPQPPDQDLIKQQIVTGLDAANAGSTAGLMEIVSESYKDEAGLSKDEIRARLTEAFSRSHDYRFRVSEPVTVINGDTAGSDCTLIAVDKNSGQQALSQPMHIDWRREKGRKWLIVPISVWRVTSTNINLPYDIDQ